MVVRSIDQPVKFDAGDFVMRGSQVIVVWNRPQQPGIERQAGTSEMIEAEIQIVVLAAVAIEYFVLALEREEIATMADNAAAGSAGQRRRTKVATVAEHSGKGR